jgi:hypothetical protein
MDLSQAPAFVAVKLAMLSDVGAGAGCDSTQARCGSDDVKWGS